MDRGSPKLIDCTLREGAQAPGVTFTVEQSKEIGAALTEAGVDMIECGHAAISAHERRRISAVADVAGGVPVLAHARATREDVTAVAETGASWVGIFLGFNQHSRRSRVRATQDELLGMTERAVSHAVSLGLSVRFTVEDASRTPDEALDAAYARAVQSGASRICFADTVGAAEPDAIGAAARRLRRRFPGVDQEFHLHNDRGLALANALAAVDGGADWISCSVNGVGERAGITDLVTLMSNLDVRGARQIVEPKPLIRLSRLVSAFARIPVSPQHPVVGRHAFVHTAELHRRAVRTDPMAYSWIDPARLGREPEAVPPAGYTIDDLFLTPEIRSASELRHHRHGPGDRYLLIDGGRLRISNQYCIVRDIPPGDPGPGHVDSHRHSVDSLFVFLGRGPGLTGLSAEVMVDGVRRAAQSPLSVFIPAGLPHSYRVLGGTGLFINSVLAADYEWSLLE